MSRLGRGLDALIKSGPESTDRTTGITTIDVSKIRPNRYQPRKVFDKAKLQELAQSLKENGLIQPIIVSKCENSQYELIAGERRLEASKLAGFSEIPVIIRSVSKKQLLQYAIIENIQRENLNSMDEAEAYMQLHEEFSLTHAQISEIIGKDRATVTNSLRLLKLHPEVRELVRGQKLSSGHARAILTLPEENQVEFSEFVMKNELSVRKTERAAKEFLASPDKKEMPKVPEGKKVVLGEMELQLKNNFGFKVKIADKNSKGRISFFYKNENERIELLKKLLK